MTADKVVPNRLEVIRKRGVAEQIHLPRQPRDQQRRNEAGNNPAEEHNIHHDFGDIVNPTIFVHKNTPKSEFEGIISHHFLFVNNYLLKFDKFLMMNDYL